MVVVDLVNYKLVTNKIALKYFAFITMMRDLVNVLFKFADDVVYTLSVEGS